MAYFLPICIGCLESSFSYHIFRFGWPLEIQNMREDTWYTLLQKAVYLYSSWFPGFSEDYESYQNILESSFTGNKSNIYLDE